MTDVTETIHYAVQAPNGELLTGGGRVPEHPYGPSWNTKLTDAIALRDKAYTRARDAGLLVDPDEFIIVKRRTTTIVHPHEPVDSREL